MRVKVWANKDKKQLGIRVGNQNRQQWFKPNWAEVVVEMDGQTGTFPITPGFWNHCPEFRDRGQPLIKNWLTRHGLIDWPKGTPPSLTLISLGDNRFRLLPK